MDARALLDSSPHAVLVMDAAGRLTYANPAAAELLGHGDPADLLGGSVLDEVHDRHREVARRLLARVRSEDLGRDAAYLQLRDGRRWVAVRAAPVDDGGVQFAATDVTWRVEAERQLRRLASHDSLTQLPGRSLLMQRLTAALADRRRGAGGVAVMFIDLDGFKLVNDALGHAAGDAVLRETARRLAAGVRPQDVVGRFGGDEFLVVATALEDEDDARVLADRVERSLRRPITVGEDEVLVSASVGVAVVSQGETTPERLVTEADNAMYRAKELGKRRYEVFDRGLHERAQERSRIEEVLREAVRCPADRVAVHYQPVVDLRTRRAVGLEALLRVVDDDGSLLHPITFLDIAVEAGVMPALDDVVLTTATRQVQIWREELGVDLELAVNVCAARVGLDLEPAVESALAASGLPRDRLLVELTEQALIDRGPQVGAAIAALHARGTRFALDDFGTGWASLTYLRRFPVSVVKVDRSFVTDVGDVREDHVIVSTICDMARRLALETTAEGVETEEQYAALLQLDPAYAQGWLFGHPTAARDVPALLARIGVVSVDAVRADR